MITFRALRKQNAIIATVDESFSSIDESKDELISLAREWFAKEFVPSFPTLDYVPGVAYSRTIKIAIEKPHDPEFNSQPRYHRQFEVDSKEIFDSADLSARINDMLSDDSSSSFIIDSPRELRLKRDFYDYIGDLISYDIEQALDQEFYFNVSEAIWCRTDSVSFENFVVTFVGGSTTLETELLVDFDAMIVPKNQKASSRFIVQIKSYGRVSNSEAFVNVRLTHANKAATNLGIDDMTLTVKLSESTQESILHDIFESVESHEHRELPAWAQRWANEGLI